MPDRDGDSQNKRHSLSDWLALHDLDLATCDRILDAIVMETVSPVSDDDLKAFAAIDREVAWLEVAEAMRVFLPGQQSVIDDTFENIVKIAVDEPGKPRKNLTLDSGPGTYPTILYSYRNEPIDALAIAHEFAHAVQIMASRGLFVPPVIRETCAFLGEGALLSHAKLRNQAQYTDLVHAWQKANHRHLGNQKERLQAALSTPDAPYRYVWNYPVARFLANQISLRCSKDCIWSVFQGKSSVNDVLRELRLA